MKKVKSILKAIMSVSEDSHVSESMFYRNHFNYELAGRISRIRIVQDYFIDDLEKHWNETKEREIKINKSCPIKLVKNYNFDIDVSIEKRKEREQKINNTILIGDQIKSNYFFQDMDEYINKVTNKGLEILKMLPLALIEKKETDL